MARPTRYACAMRSLAILFSCLLAACADTAPQKVVKETFGAFAGAEYRCLTWQDTKRCYYLVPPKGKPKQLVMALHPAFTSVKLTEDVSQLAKTIVPQGVAVVYPVGIDKQWNDGRVMTDVETYNRKTDDVGFIDAVTQTVQKEFGLSPAQTLVAGMSNGGMMSLRLACQSDRYGKVATVVANLPKELRAQCAARPKPMLLIFGTDDQVVDYAGGPLASSGKPNTWGEVESAKDTEAFFAARNGCDARRTKARQLADGDIDDTTAHITEYQGCKTAPLTTIHVEGMGHTWPGESSRLMAWISTRGAVSKQFSATGMLMDFVQGDQ